MKRPCTQSVSALPERRLELEFIDGARYTVNLAQDIERLPGLRPLHDDAAFSRVLDALEQARPIPKVVRLAIKGWENEHSGQEK